MTNKLAKFFLLTLLITSPFYLISSEKIVQKKINSTNETLPNFGYFEHLSLNNLNNANRDLSHDKLYYYILDHLELDKDDRVLEVGTFKGLGAKIISSKYSAKTYTGIDFSLKNLENAKKLNQDLLSSNNSYQYLAINAQKIPFKKNHLQNFSQLILF